MKKRPNILLILADQFRIASLTGMGDGIETPNIDRIREKGMFFREAACASPLCTPSRAALATGKMPYRCGVPVHDANLPKDETTYYQILRRNGYRVALAGKADLHKQDHYEGRNGNTPAIFDFGFTDPFETEGKMNSGTFPRRKDGTALPHGPYQHYLYDRDPALLEAINKYYLSFRKDNLPVWHSEASPLPAGDFLDRFIGQHAVSFLETAENDFPWHLFVSFAGPHNPWDPPEETLERIDAGKLSLPPADDLRGKPEWVRKRAAVQSRGLSESNLRNTKRCYAAAVAEIDSAVGQILDVLERRRMAEDTVIVFAADHGEMMGDHSLFEKRTMYEGAVRIPLIVHLPGMDQPEYSDALASLMDLAPTFLELAEAPYDKNLMDAVSLLPLLRKTGDGELRKVQKSELINTVMLYDGQYKWIRSFNDSDELYDLSKDPDELHNCIDSHPEIIDYFRKYTFRA